MMEQENHDKNARISIPRFPSRPGDASSGKIEGALAHEFGPPTVYVKKLEISTTKIVPSWEETANNRVLNATNADRFLVVSFVIDEILTATGRKEWTPKAEYIQSVLTNGFSVGRTMFHFFYGYPSKKSQGNRKTCLCLAGSKNEVWAKIMGLGDFSRVIMSGEAKLAKRMGLFFSDCQPVMTITEDDFQVIDDDVQFVNGHKEVFSDGCGYIGKKWMEKVAYKMNIRHREGRLVPSVIQIRYRGFKGVLALNPTISSIQFRWSMKKFDCSTNDRFCVCEYSRPYTFGRLNQQVIALLSALGIPDQVFHRLQEEHYDKLEQLPYDFEVAFRFLCSVGKLALANKLLENGLTPEIQAKLKKRQAKEMNCARRRGRTEEKQRLRIPVEKSRSVFCVNDPTEILVEGTCFFAPTIDGEAKPLPLPNHLRVIAVRNPCLHPGDILHLTPVDVSECHHLVDCIVFPVNGKRSTASASSGGDLDGDKFLVIWEPDLLPPCWEHPYSYPAAREAVSANINLDSMIAHFTNCKGSSLGTLNRLYWEWANRNGILSRECEELNRLFSQAVDGQRTQIPRHLRESQTAVVPGRRIWENLLLQTEKKYAEYLQTRRASAFRQDSGEVAALTFDALMNMVQSDNLCLSDYDLLEICYAFWMRQSGSAKCEFKDFSPVHHIDFCNFTFVQKEWAAVCCGIPREVLSNALNRSAILEPSLLRELKLDEEGFHWKLYYSSYADERYMMSVLADALCRFTRTLIVLQYSADFSVAIYVPVQLRMNENNPLQSDRVVVFGFRGGRLFEKRLMNEQDVIVYIDDCRFQLFCGLTANQAAKDTFIFLKRTVDKTAVIERRHCPANVNGGRSGISPPVSVVNLSSIAVLNRRWFRDDLSEYMSNIQRQRLLGIEVYVVTNKKPILVRSYPVGNDMLVQLLPAVPLSDYQLPGVNQPHQDDADTVAQLKIFLENGRLLPRCTVDQLLALVDCAGRYGRADRRFVLIEQYLKQYTFQSILMEAFVCLSLFPSAVILFLKLLHASDQPLDTSRCALVVTALIRCSATDGSFAVLEAAKLVTKLLQQQRQFTVTELASCFSAAALTEDPALGFEFCELLRDVQLCPSPYFVEFAYKLCLDLLEEKERNLRSEEQTRNGPAGQDTTGYSRVQFTAKIVEEVQAEKPNEEKGQPLKAPKAKEYKKFVYTAQGLPLNSMRVGDVLRIKRLNNRTGSSKREVALGRTIQGVISEVAPAVQVEFHSAPPAEIEAATWHMQVVGNSTTFKQSLAALECVVTQQSACTAAYDRLMSDFELEKEEAETTELDETDGDLQPSQMSALKAALSGSLTLIQGPPGTGKTHTVVYVLIEMVKKHGPGEVLAVASNNKAADNILRELAKHDFFKDRLLVRTGDRSAISQDLHKFSLDAHVKGDVNRRPREVRKIVQRTAVVVSTCASAGTGAMKKLRFKCVVMDEASQVTEPCALVPVVKGSEQVVLVGDHQQLPPTVTGKRALAAGLDQSLFARLCTKHPKAVHMLTEHFRCHPFIIEFPSLAFYEGRLSAMVDAADRPPVPGFAWPNLERPVAVIDVLGHEVKDYLTHSFKNLNETAMIVNILKSITAFNRGKDVANAVTGKDIGIVTPYADQKACIKAALSANQLSAEIEVDTVDSFQGREKELMIFSAVRTSDKGDLRFFQDRRRFNVVMTRARRGLVVVANCPFLRAMGDSVWCEWLGYVQHHRLLTDT